MHQEQTSFSEFLKQEEITQPLTIKKNLSELLKQKKISIASCESMTSGYLSYLLTEEPGSSQYFLGGIIAYNNAIKVNQLGVLPKTIAQKGVVSEETAIEMAENIKKRFKSDIGISITGFAGPSSQKIEKIGLCFIGLASPMANLAYKFIFEGNREEIRKKAADTAISMLYFEVKGMA